MAKNTNITAIYFGSATKAESVNRKAQLCKEIQANFSEDIVGYIVDLINKICDAELIIPTTIKSFTNLNDFFQVIFELEYLQNSDKTNIISSFTECTRKDKVSIVAIKFISYNDKNDLCIYHDTNSNISISELQELYHEYVRKEIFHIS